MSETFGTTQKIKNIHADVDLLTSTMTGISVDMDSVSSGIALMVPDIEEIRIDIDLLTSTQVAAAANITLMTADIDSLSSLGIGLKAGSNIIGKVYSDGSMPYSAQTRSTDTTGYAVGDVVGTNPATNLTFANILNTAGAQFVILGANMEVDSSAVPTNMGNFRLHLYNAAPTAILDNSPFNLPSADRAKYLGYMTLATPVLLGDTLWSQNDNKNFAGKLAAGSSTLSGMVETLSSYVPTASCVKTVFLNLIGA